MPKKRKPAGQTRCEQGTKDYPLPLKGEDAALALATSFADSGDPDLTSIGLIAIGAFRLEGSIPPDVRRDLARHLGIKIGARAYLGRFFGQESDGA